MVNNTPQSRLQILTQTLSNARSKFQNIDKRLKNAEIESMQYENSNAENLSPLYDEYHTALETFRVASNELARALNEMSQQETNSNANSNNNPSSPASNNSNTNNHNNYNNPIAGGKRRNKKSRKSRKSRK